jgi:hypothetical protein
VSQISPVLVSFDHSKTILVKMSIFFEVWGSKIASSEKDHQVTGLKMSSS